MGTSNGLGPTFYPDLGTGHSAPLMNPYPGAGSGHAGNDTSRERQEREDSSGITAETQRLVLTQLVLAQTDGMTAAEVEDLFGIGHGRASSALSHLQRAGHITRLKERRSKHEVYVLPECVNGREESPYRPRLKPARHPRDLPDTTVQAAMETARIPLEALGIIRKFLEVLP